VIKTPFGSAALDHFTYHFLKIKPWVTMISTDKSWFPQINHDKSSTNHDSQFIIGYQVLRGWGLDIQIRSPRIALVGALELILLCLLVMKAGHG
jgi:hypothetical protein